MSYGPTTAEFTFTYQGLEHPKQLYWVAQDNYQHSKYGSVGSSNQPAPAHGDGVEKVPCVTDYSVG